MGVKGQKHWHHPVGIKTHIISHGNQLITSEITYKVFQCGQTGHSIQFNLDNE